MYLFSAAAYDHSDCDCFGCAILSHGREGFVYATDRLIPLEALTVPFKGDRCPTLVGKPKLFFIQVWEYEKLVWLLSRSTLIRAHSFCFQDQK